MKERNYIRYRKLKAFASRLCFLLCRVFPVRDGRVSFCAFEGRGGFGCNPKYIAEELHKRNPGYELIWFVNDMHKQFPPYIRKVPNTLWSRAFWLSTSKIWVDNYRKPYGTCKRRGQFYINTWHATIAFKSIGLWRGDAFSRMAYLVSKNDSDMIDDVVIDSEWCAEVYPKGMVYEGNYLWAGAPRCDVLYGDRTKYKESFRRQHGIDKDVRIAMFAPTFRERAVNGKREVFSETWTLDFKRLLRNLGKRFGGEWVLCLRIHPQLAPKAGGYKDSHLKNKLIDISQEDDMYEALAAMDAFITDYSSAAMDAGYAHMPVFIYADDIEKYVTDRGSLLWDMSAGPKQPIRNNKEMTPDIDTVLPYPVARDNDEMERNILGFNMDSYTAALKQFEEAVGLVFDGKASARVADRIEFYMEQ